MKALNLRNQIDIETLLSSTTYKTNFFDRCIYCHKDVESDYFQYNEEWYQPNRCNCEKAKEELKLKETLLNELTNLQKDIDIDKINEVTKESIICEVERAYDEDCEDILHSIIDN